MASMIANARGKFTFPPYRRMAFLPRGPYVWKVRLIASVALAAITACTRLPEPPRKTESVRLQMVQRPAAAQKLNDFQREVQPILERRCQPCHFTGGQMYEKLPFDEPRTIVELGEKLFTRIKAEEERAAIRKFLSAQQTRRLGFTRVTQAEVRGARRASSSTRRKGSIGFER